MRPLRRGAAAVALAVAALSSPPRAAASGPVPPGWEFAQDLAVPAAGLVEVRLPAATLDAAQPELEDLRVFDARVGEIPFAFVPRAVPAARAALPAVEVSLSSTEDATVGVYRTAGKGLIDTVTVRTPAPDFIKPVTVEASDDRGQWRALAVRHPVHRQPRAGERLDIKVPPGRYPYLKVTVGDARERSIPLAGIATVEAAPEPQDVETLVLHLSSVSSLNGSTRALLNLPARHLSLHRLALDPEDPVFSREVTLATRESVDGEVRETVFARGRIHRVALTGAERTEVVSIPVSPRPLGSLSLVVTIEDGDSPPLALRRAATLTLEPVRLRFLARPGERYTLAVGSRGAKAPRYDLSSVAAVGELRPAGLATPGPLERNPSYQQPEPAKGAAPEGAAIDPARWRHARRVVVAAGVVQSLEVPPEVLATSPGLADLRLVADGRQLPYILERGTIARRLELPVEKLPPERGGAASRWRIALPHRGLPLESVACEAPETVFRRGVTVSEELPPERGGRVFLASAVWERRGQGTEGPLRIPLGRGAAGDSLLIEVDDGDNPPLGLRGCTVAWRTSRLIFKQVGAREVSLLYGNPGVGPPRYDLALLADELLAADAAAATLAPDEGRRGGSGFAMPSGWPRWAFWGALALVVAVLIGVIAKLLPSQDTR